MVEGADRKKEGSLMCLAMRRYSRNVVDEERMDRCGTEDRVVATSTAAEG